MRAEELKIEPADLLLFWSRGWLPWIIRRFLPVNHAGVAIAPWISVEAGWPRITKFDIREYMLPLNRGDMRLAVYRPAMLNEPMKAEVCRRAISIVGRPYDVLGLVVHGLDEIAEHLEGVPQHNWYADHLGGRHSMLCSAATGFCFATVYEPIKRYWELDPADILSIVRGDAGWQRIWGHV